MAKHSKISEAKFLEQARVALENAESQSMIATIMAEYGYDATAIAQGKTVYTETRQAFDTNKTEDDETSEAYANFSALKQQLYDTFYSHRKKARVIFRNDSVTADKLAISGSMPQAYIKWLETVKKFYSVAVADATIQTKLSKLKITPDDLNTTNDLIPQVEKARAEYLREKGESQDATNLKDAAFAKLDEWMFEFYAVAKIALEDNPQLLEALGLVVKN